MQANQRHTQLTIFANPWGRGMLLTETRWKVQTSHNQAPQQIMLTWWHLMISDPSCHRDLFLDIAGTVQTSQHNQP